MLGLDSENTVDGGQREYGVFLDNYKVARKYAHCHDATFNSSFLTNQASSCAQHPT